MTDIITDEELRYAMTLPWMVESMKRPIGRPKDLKHTEESKAKMSVKRQARTQPRSATSGQFIKMG